MDESKLFAALNRFWKPITMNEYWYEMDVPGLNDAIDVSQFPEDIFNKIFTIKKEPFAMW